MNGFQPDGKYLFSCRKGKVWLKPDICQSFSSLIPHKYTHIIIIYHCHSSYKPDESSANYEGQSNSKHYKLLVRKILLYNNMNPCTRHGIPRIWWKDTDVKKNWNHMVYQPDNLIGKIFSALIKISIGSSGNMQRFGQRG